MKTILNWCGGKFSRLFFWLFLISLPFGYRVLLFKFTPGFDEYEAIFLYASDVLMVLFLLTFYAKTFSCLNTPNLPSKTRIILLQWQNFLFPRPDGSPSARPSPSGLRDIFSDKFGVFLVFLNVFLFFAGLSIFFASYKFLALYNFIRLVLLVLTALAIAESLRRNWIKLETILAVLAGSAVFQSFIAFFQFLNQKSLGLWFFGESVLGPGIPGVAKIVVTGAKILRAYGTFPHPNVLAAFLLLGLFGAYFCFFKVFNRQNKFWPGLLTAISIFIISLGLTLTFSRAAWFLALVLTLIFVVCLFRQKNFRRQTCYFSVILFFIFLILLLVLGQLIFPRAQIFLNEQAVSQRISYSELGWYLVKTHPLGVGLGNQVIYSVKNGVYQLFGMSQVWQWQPIHNIYLLASSEIGILGLMAFLFFLVKLLISNYQFLISNKTSISNDKNFGNCLPQGDVPKGQKLEIGNLTIMLLALVLFGLFDHFLWTLQPGRLMLWLVLGIMLGVKPL